MLFVAEPLKTPVRKPLTTFLLSHISDNNAYISASYHITVENKTKEVICAVLKKMTPPQWELTEDEINEISTEFQRVGGNNTYIIKLLDMNLITQIRLY